MKNEIENYLDAIGITKPIKDRVDYFIKISENLCNEGIVDIFIDDYIMKDGDRKYSGITFFTKNYSIVVNNFLDEEKISMGSLTEKITYVGIDIKDYDFKKPIDKSRISINITLESNLEGLFKASKENCDYLINIFFKYILPYINK